MKRALVKLLCLFIPVKRWRQKLRGRPVVKPLKEVLASLPFLPSIKNSEETIEALCSNSKSMCRFGDGEFSLMEGKDIIFQKGSEKMAQRLNEVLRSDDKNILIGINYYFWYLRSSAYDIIENFHNSWVSVNLKRITSYLSPKKIYYNSTFTAPFSAFKDIDFDAYYTKIKKIWKNRDITIICGKTIFDKITHNIFDCAKSVEYLYAPSKNAFDEYDVLLNQAKGVNKKRLVILILGPTATILAYDLAKAGYQALDFGHIAKDYDWYKKKVDHNNETLQDFFNPD